MPLDTYLLYLAAVAVFFATPPDTSQLLIISNTIRQGVRRSVLTIIGDLSANIIQMTAAAFGLAAIIASSAVTFTVIKWLGVAYLAWIGWQLIRTPSSQKLKLKSAPAKAAQLYRQGFVTSMANPYAVIFFGALFPQFIDATDPVLPQLLILGATYLIVDGLILLLWAWVALKAAQWLENRSFDVINKLCGSLMLMAAALLAAKDLQPEQQR